MFIFGVKDFVGSLWHTCTFFNQRLSVRIDNKWNLHRFLILGKLKYFVPYVRHFYGTIITILTHICDISLLSVLRGCLYGGELAWLGGLALLGEILPSLRNSYKNIMCSYEKWASPPKWDLTWFCRDPTQVRLKFSMWTCASGPAQQGGIEFSLINFVLFFRC